MNNNIKGIKVRNMQVCKYKGLESIENFIKNLESVYEEIDLKSVTIEKGYVEFVFDTYEDFDKTLKTIPDIKVNINDKEVILDQNIRVIKSRKYVIVETAIYCPQLLEKLECIGKLTLCGCKADYNDRKAGEYEEVFYFDSFDYIESTSTEKQKNRFYYCFNNGMAVKNPQEIMKIVNEAKKLERDK